MAHRRLILLRHAKSSWVDPHARDHERGLAERGLSAAPIVGAVMAATLPMPDLVLCSSATRTRLTWALAAEAAGWTSETRFEDGLYLCGAGNLLTRLRGVAPQVRVLLVVGHNPDLDELTQLLDAGRTPREGFPTAAFAQFTLKDEWHRLGPESATLTRFETPKALQRAAAVAALELQT